MKLKREKQSFKFAWKIIMHLQNCCRNWKMSKAFASKVHLLFMSLKLDSAIIYTFRFCRVSFETLKRRSGSDSSNKSNLYSTTNLTTWGENAKWSTDIFVRGERFMWRTFS
ncbi:Hypothetical predicted protein [Olea europaea subsp. europaea]|uniref:Uncharacterized protein n=1 Tax=Olea europaea subsp. europaea TaxID=158383 RepID=A0A8S0RA04_OLEEU|nr:Hypothetical predicted protein [Olea europaea subsp. europaea]